MGWSPTWLRYEYVLIGLGVVLLVNPLYVGALHLDEPNWFRYESAPVEFTDDNIDAPIDAIARGIDDDVACLNDNHRVCQLEHYVNRSGGVSYPDRMAAGPGSGYRYVYLDHRFYRVVPFTVGGSGELDLEPIPRREVLGYIATPLDRVSPAIRTAVTSGSVEVHHRLDGANQLVRDGSTYYVVYRTAGTVFGSRAYAAKALQGRIVEVGLMVLLGVTGLWLILRGQRHRLRRR